MVCALQTRSVYLITTSQMSKCEATLLGRFLLPLAPRPIGIVALRTLFGFPNVYLFALNPLGVVAVHTPSGIPHLGGVFAFRTPNSPC
eukprot:4076362-Amphidinium_carterae.2